MDGFLMLALVIVGALVLWDKGRHAWLRYGWFFLAGFTVAWIAEAIWIVYFMRF